MSPAPVAVKPSTIELQWEQNSDPSIVSTRVFRASGQEGDDADWEPIQDVVGDRLEVDGCLPWRTYRFAAASVFRDGSVAPRKDWVEASICVDAERPALPATPANFGASQDRAVIHFQWDPNTDGITEGYEIRRGAWADGLLVGRTTHPWFEAPWLDAATRTYLVAAYDGLGGYGAAASLSVQVAALPNYVLTSTTDESGGGFAGTKSNTAVVGGALRLAVVPANIDAATAVIDTYTTPAWSRTWNTGTYTTAAIDLGALGTHRIEVKILAANATAAGLVIDDYDCVIGTPERDSTGQWVDPTTRGPSQRLFCDGANVETLGILAEIDTAPDAGGSPTWDGFRPYVPGEYYARQIRFRYTLTGDGFVTPSIASLSFYHRQKNLKDEVAAAVAGTPGPTAVTWAAGFTAAPKVVATVVDAGGAEFIALASDITTSGCNVRAYDAAGAEVFTGTIHVIAAGV